jgi:hypothetical protein
LVIVIVHNTALFLPVSRFFFKLFQLESLSA